MFLAQTQIGSMIGDILYIFYFRDIDLPMMKKQALTSTPPDSTCSVLLCWPGLLMPLSWSVSGWVQKFASSKPLRNKKMEPYRAQREVSSFAVQMDST